MHGKDYIATVRLSNKADDTLAEIGSTCERIPAESLPWLIKEGLVTPAPHRKPAAVAAGEDISHGDTQ